MFSGQWSVVSGRWLVASGDLLSPGSSRFLHPMLSLRLRLRLRLRLLLRLLTCQTPLLPRVCEMDQLFSRSRDMSVESVAALVEALLDSNHLVNDPDANANLDAGHADPLTTTPATLTDEGHTVLGLELAVRVALANRHRIMPGLSVGGGGPSRNNGFGTNSANGAEVPSAMRAGGADGLGLGGGLGGGVGGGVGGGGGGGVGGGGGGSVASGGPPGGPFVWPTLDRFIRKVSGWVLF